MAAFTSQPHNLGERGWGLGWEKYIKGRYTMQLALHVHTPLHSLKHLFDQRWNFVPRTHLAPSLDGGRL